MNYRCSDSKEECADNLISKYKWPENIKLGDKYLFEKAYHSFIPEGKDYRFDNVQLYSDLIHINNCELFTGTRAFWHIIKSKHFISKLVFIRRRSASLGGGKRNHKCINIDKGVLITEQWSNEYAHWIGEALPRLFSAWDNHSGACLLLPSKYKKYDYIVESLKFFNVKTVYFDNSTALVVKELLVPCYLLPSGRFDKSIMCGMSEFILGQIRNSNDGNAIRKIYISRQHAKRRKISNEKEVKALVKRYGFEVIIAENIVFGDAVKLYSETNVLVSIHGAGLVNLAFVPSGGKVLELRRQGDAHNNMFYSLANVLGHDYYYQQCKSKYHNPITWCADLIVDIDELENNLKLMGCIESDR